jgi:glycosyltransferase involved in cell wall biosynthesis
MRQASSCLGRLPVLADGHLASASKERLQVVELPRGPLSVAVSLIVPAYNSRPFLGELLEGIRPQLGDDAELVLVDDGSTDGSFEFVVAHATALGLSGRVVRLACNRGRSVARNVGILHARGSVLAFTDSDCVPAHGWLHAGLTPLADNSVGVVQGKTGPHPRQRRHLFAHYIEIGEFDGTFSTCNVFYRKRAVMSAGGFDPRIEYWEDLDLGWRVCRNGWTAAFASEAVVYHQVLPLSPVAWLAWPRHFAYMPDKVAAYPEYRRYLFLGLWVHWLNALFELALISLLASTLDKRWLLLTLPYAIAFPRRYGARGRWPLAKVAFHVSWDFVTVFALLSSSLRRRTLVL